jgi:hypothetical protein
MADNIINTTAKVHKLRPVPAAKGMPLHRSRHKQRRLRRQAGTAIGVGFVAVTLTALSLSHLAHGVMIVTGSAPWEAWSMAVGVDLGFVALELSQLAIDDKLRKQVSRFAKPAIFGTLAGSAAMNAYAFSAHTADYIMLAAAVTLGVAIPTLIYCLTRVGAALYIDCHGRA